LPRLSRATLLNRPDDHRFALDSAPAPSRTFFATAHVTLAGLDKTAQFIAPIAVGHRFAQLMQQQPDGLVAAPNLLFQLHGRDAIPIVAEEINRPEPTS
jgi:hypothetical protein